MSLTWWALFLAAVAGVVMCLGAMARPDHRYARAVFCLSLILFTASGVLTLVAGGA